MNGLNKASNILICQTSVRDDMRNDEHNKTIGCFKDEFNSRGMSEMLGLNPKSHALKFQHIKKNKGVSKAVVKQILTLNRCKLHY